MSNIYIQEPPALGKVLLKTSVGDIDVELWTKEAPKACRNFIQLCLEGYYNGTIFHRVVPDFIVQGGDPRGDGTGGESVYGSPFKDEFHSRLRFNRRGLVAMANAGKDDNGSQFFFTLNSTPELQNKHTIFGKVSGETVFNMLKLADGLTDGDDRPLYPHKITSTEVLENPFDDIVPRVTVKEKRDVESSKEKKRKDKVGVKNFGLLSFGAEAEEEEDGAVVYSGKPKSTHDLLDDPKLSKKTAADLDIEEVLVTDKNASLAVSSIREKLQKKDKTEAKPKELEAKSDSDDGEYYVGKDKEKQRRKQTEAIRDEIKKMKKDMKPSRIVEDTASENTDSRKEKKENELKVQYEEEQEKYKKLKQNIPKKGSERESFTLALLKKFQSKLSAAKEKAEENKVESSTSEADALDTDDWLAHKLHFEDKGAVLAKDASTKGDDWFDIYDPRNPLNKRKREENKQPKNKFAKKDVL